MTRYRVPGVGLVDVTLEIRVAGARGRPRSRPDRVLADKGYPSKANRAWLRERGIAATIPERDDQIAHRRKRRRAISQYDADKLTGRDFMAPAFMRIILADSELAAMRAAFTHASAAREERLRLAEADRLTSDKLRQLMRVEEQERRRGAELRVRADALLKEARSTIEHQESGKPWLRRLARLEDAARA